MKRIKTLVITICCLSVLLLLTGCGTKTAISPDDFKSKMEDKGYVVVDPMPITEYTPEIEKVYNAQDEDKSFEIIYLQIDSDDNAKKLYTRIKEDFEKLKSGAVVETNVDLKNNNKYTLQNAGEYKVVSRIDNTIIYLSVDDSYKKEINEILKDLGY